MKIKTCKNIFSKARGLMFSRKKNLLFVFKDERRRSLHMMFVFFPIDVYFLDKDKRVVEVKRLGPFEFYTSKKKAKYILEISLRKEEFKNKEIKK